MLRRGQGAAFVAAGFTVALGGIVGRASASPIRPLSAQEASRSVSFDVMLPLRNKAELETLLTQLHDPASPLFHHWLTPLQFAGRFGPTAATRDGAAGSLRAEGLGVQEGVRSLHVSGSVAVVSKALSTSLGEGTLPSGAHHLMAFGAPKLPAAVTQAGGVMLSFSPAAHEHQIMSRRVSDKPLDVRTLNRSSSTGGYWYDDLKQAYQFPSYQTFVRAANGKEQRLDGTGATVGILIGADVLDSDIDLVFNHENFTKNSGQPANPKLFKRVYVNGGAPAAGLNGGEAALDVQQALTGAPGSHVILYDTPDQGDDNLIAGYTRIVDDNEVDIVNSSFGICELVYTAAYNNGVDFTSILNMYHELFEQGNAEGISFLASSGDEAGLSCPTPSYATDGLDGSFVVGVQSPADDPNVTAVGGTNLVTKSTQGSLDSSYVGENAFSDPENPYDIYGFGANVSGGAFGAGGGVSTIFKRPLYQIATDTGSATMRALPDIGMEVGGCTKPESVEPCNGGDNPLNGNGNTDRSSAIVAAFGEFFQVVGTSVASPELAGATALMVERYGRMGNLNNWIYLAGTAQTLAGNRLPALNVFHRNIPGFNQVVTNDQPGKNWNYTVGNGTPVVYKFVGAADAQPAGAPQSPSNP